MSLVKIGELAQEFAVSTDTIRYYETHQLLIPKQRSAAGYRLYDAANRNTLAFILHAKRVGFTLQEVKYLLHIEENKTRYSCEVVKQFVDKKRDKVKQQLAQLQQMEVLLTQLSASCEGGELSAQHCAILDGIEIGRVNEE